MDRSYLGVKALLVLGVVGWVGTPAWGNLLLNPGFEEGYTTNWTLSAGTLNGEGLGEDPHSGLKSWHGAWNWYGSAQTTRYYQDVPVTAGKLYDASMWAKGNAWGGLYRNDTHSFQLRIRFRNTAGTNLTTHDVSSMPDDTWQQLVHTNLEAPAGAVAARVMFAYITTQPANEWKVWNIDDLSFTEVPEPGMMALLGLGLPVLLWRRR